MYRIQSTQTSVEHMHVHLQERCLPRNRNRPRPRRAGYASTRWTRTTPNCSADVPVVVMIRAGLMFRACLLMPRNGRTKLMLQKLVLHIHKYFFHTIRILVQKLEDIKIQDFGNIGCQDILITQCNYILCTTFIRILGIMMSLKL